MMDKYDRYEAWVEKCRNNGWSPRVAHVEVRASGDEPPRIEGYAAVFDSPSQDLGGFKEVIRKGAFSRSLSEKQDVRALQDHEPSRILGRTKSGTLDLREDKKGLKVSIRPPNTSLANDLMASMQRGDVDQMSFAFAVRKQRWTWSRDMDKGDDADGLDLRELLDVDLFDVSVVTFPAYTDTTVDVRSRECAAEEDRLLAKVEAMRSRLTDTKSGV